eukprot:359613-Chlamydomonas_euryale.AAC.9
MHEQTGTSKCAHLVLMPDEEERRSGPAAHDADTFRPRQRLLQLGIVQRVHFAHTERDRHQHQHRGALTVGRAAAAICRL